MSVQCAGPPAAVDFAVAETDECIEGGRVCRGCVKRARGEQDKANFNGPRGIECLRLLPHVTEKLAR